MHYTKTTNTEERDDFLFGLIFNVISFININNNKMKKKIFFNS